ncbi:hypothetical protein [Protofrankia symbiont of Coriaria ruscifolia]|uniref:hypothetical protein n=1 Tax=Protofrankia symbiont of Coriaria ruscifolia TaxID=1306542 RepID=UPI0013EF936F|nr:hypothetical protein [Protofrankia symbiont of Coriaria ruscifolia]
MAVHGGGDLTGAQAVPAGGTAAITLRDTRSTPLVPRWASVAGVIAVTTANGR